MIGYLTIVIGIFTGDLLLKNHMEKRLKNGREQELFDGRLKLRLHHNRGFALNRGSSVQPFVAFFSLCLALVCTALFLVSFGRGGGGLLKLGLSFLLGGAYSNTYDRLKRKYVVDYVSFCTRWKRFSDIVFNVSDFCILAGALLICLSGDRTG